MFRVRDLRNRTRSQVLSIDARLSRRLVAVREVARNRREYDMPPVSADIGMGTVRVAKGAVGCAANELQFAGQEVFPVHLR